jgi:hypothetical protein
VGEKRQLTRREFSLYMSVIDEGSGKTLGTLSDISTGGFKLESRTAIPLNVNLRLRIDHTHEISTKKYIAFTARARWCQRDQIDRFSYNIGFQIVDMTPSDYDIFVQMFNSYGTSRGSEGHQDYFWN